MSRKKTALLGVAVAVFALSGWRFAAPVESGSLGLGAAPRNASGVTDGRSETAGTAMNPIEPTSRQVEAQRKAEEIRAERYDAAYQREVAEIDEDELRSEEAQEQQSAETSHGEKDYNQDEIGQALAAAPELVVDPTYRETVEAGPDEEESFPERPGAELMKALPRGHASYQEARERYLAVLQELGSDLSEEEWIARSVQLKKEILPEEL